MFNQISQGKIITRLFNNFYIIYIHNDKQMKIINLDTNEIFFNTTITFDSAIQFQEKVGELRRLFLYIKLNATDL